MAQNDIQITTTPPLAGLTLVQGVNGALQSLATDFAGSVDPAAIGGVGPYCTWADTGNGLLKRRNAAGTDWVVEGTLFKASLPQYAEADIPASDKGPIYVIGKGPMEWDGAAYAPSTRTGAAKVSYDNTSSGLSAENTKDAIDELAGEKLDAANAFGVGQTWQNVTASRALGVTYTNSTGKPIQLMVNSTLAASGVSGSLYVNEQEHQTAVYPGSTTNGYVLLSATIPDGATYQVVYSAGISLRLWWELRS